MIVPPPASSQLTSTLAELSRLPSSVTVMTNGPRVTRCVVAPASSLRRWFCIAPEKRTTPAVRRLNRPMPSPTNLPLEGRRVGRDREHRASASRAQDFCLSRFAWPLPSSTVSQFKGSVIGAKSCQITMIPCPSTARNASTLVPNTQTCGDPPFTQLNKLSRFFQRQTAVALATQSCRQWPTECFRPEHPACSRQNVTKQKTLEPLQRLVAVFDLRLQNCPLPRQSHTAAEFRPIHSRARPIREGMASGQLARRLAANRLIVERRSRGSIRLAPPAWRASTRARGDSQRPP